MKKYVKNFYPKNFLEALKNTGLGSEIRKKPIPDPVVIKRSYETFVTSSSFLSTECYCYQIRIRFFVAGYDEQVHGGASRLRIHQFRQWSGKCRNLCFTQTLFNSQLLSCTAPVPFLRSLCWYRRTLGYFLRCMILGSFGQQKSRFSFLFCLVWWIRSVVPVHICWHSSLHRRPLWRCIGWEARSFPTATRPSGIYHIFFFIA